MQNGTATLKDSLVVSYKTKQTLTTQSSNHAPWYLIYPNKLKTYVHTNLLKHVCASLICNFQN